MPSSEQTDPSGTQLMKEVTDLVIRYGTAIDTRDWASFRSVFTKDVDIDYGPGVGRHSDADAFTDFMRQGHDPAGDTLHRMSNTVVTVAADGVAARTYGDAIVLAADNRAGTHAAAYYDDEFVREDGGLKISRRHCHVVLYEAIPHNLAAAG